MVYALKVMRKRKERVVIVTGTASLWLHFISTFNCVAT